MKNEYTYTEYLLFHKHMWVYGEFWEIKKVETDIYCVSKFILIYQKYIGICLGAAPQWTHSNSKSAKVCTPLIPVGKEMVLINKLIMLSILVRLF